MSWFGKKILKKTKRAYHKAIGKGMRKVIKKTLRSLDKAGAGGKLIPVAKITTSVPTPVKVSVPLPKVVIPVKVIVPIPKVAIPVKVNLPAPKIVTPVKVNLPAPKQATIILSQKQEIVKPLSKTECERNCIIRKNNCLDFNTANPNPAKAVIIHRCHANKETCMNFCNKIN